MLLPATSGDKIEGEVGWQAGRLAGWQAVGVKGAHQRGMLSLEVKPMSSMHLPGL
jgi:hypothetical protein